MLQQLLWRLMRIRPLVALTGIASQYESKIRSFEEAPAKPGSVVFFGSSSLRLWSSLESDMAGIDVVNAGFGGAHASHLALFQRRVLPRHQPRAVVVYAGDNDLASGKSPDEVERDLRAFIAQLDHLCVVLLLVKRSPQRAHLDAEVDALNARLRALPDTVHDVVVVDTDAPLRGPDGLPDRRFFGYDGLHLSPAGYTQWTAVLKPVLLGLRGSAGVGERAQPAP